MKRIAFYIGSLSYGGAERTICNLANEAAIQGCEVALITSYPCEPMYPLESRIEHKILWDKPMTGFLKKNYMQIRNLRKICKNYKPEVLVSFMGEPNCRAVIATMGLPVKCIISVRNDPNKEYAGFMGRWIGKHLLPMADGCVFQTKDARSWFPDKLQAKSTIIFNAVKETFFEKEWCPISHRAVAVGRLTAQKNYSMMIKAFSKVVAIYPDAILDIFGDGTDREVIQRLIDSYQMKDHIFLRGHTNRVLEEVSSANVFLMSSDYEGMPNALMEALAMGVPSISTDCPCGGPRELICSGENGFLVSCNDDQTMAEYLKEIFTNKEKSKEISIKAKKDAHRYQPDRISREWMKYYETVLSR